MTPKEMQLELEKMHNKNQMMPRIRDVFINAPNNVFVQQMQSKEIPVPFGLDLLAQIALHKRADIATLVGTLRRHCSTLNEVVDLIMKSAVAGLINYDRNLDVFIVKFGIPAEVQAELDRFQYPLPMLIKPHKLKKNTDSAYLLPMGSLILKNNHHEEDIVLDHLNRLNAIPLQINIDVVNKVKNSWKDLDRRKEGESTEEHQKRIRAFQKYDRCAKDMLNKLNAVSDVVYITNKYDKRGRTYSQGYHFSPQGNSWNKATVLFYNKEVIE